MGSGPPDASLIHTQVEGAAIVAADVADPYVLLRFDDDSAAVLVADSTTGEYVVACQAQAGSTVHFACFHKPSRCVRAEREAFTAGQWSDMSVHAQDALGRSAIAAWSILCA